MATTKISALPEASAVNASDVVPVVQSSATKKAAFSVIANYVLNSFTMSLGAVTRTVKTAIDALQTKVGTASLNTTATDLCGAVNEHESDISTINSNYTSLIVEKAYQASFSISANGSQVLKNTDFGTSTPSGYTILGIKSFTTANSAVFVAGINPAGASEVARLHNVASSAQSGTMTVRFLYIRSAAISVVS